MSVELTKDDVLVSTEQKEGLVSQSENELTVVLDTNLTPALVEEGFVREIISKVQTMRKEAGFEVADHIVLSYEGNSRIHEILSRFGADVLKDTLGDRLVSDKAQGYVKEWEINGETVTLGVERV